MSSLPFVLPEDQLRPFNFYHQGQLQPAVLFRDCVYVMIQKFNADNRLNAYQRSDELNALTEVLMTVSERGYRLWVEQQASDKIQMIGAA